MKYQVLLTGGKTLTVDEKTAKTIEAYWNKEESMKVAIGRNTIDTKTIKGIFEIQEEDFSAQTKKSKEESVLFYNGLEQSLKMTPEERAVREVKVRILPGWKLSGNKREDPEMMDAFKNIKEFFINNPNYPYCPSRVWWPSISSKLQTSLFVSGFFRYVFKHDFVVEQWMKGRG